MIRKSICARRSLSPGAPATRQPYLVCAVAAAALLPGRPVVVHSADASNSDFSTKLQTVNIVATGVSNMGAASAGDVSQEQLANQPQLRPGALLENVPGLIVTQHSGEGKANRYFLRAFNLDHGTDLATEVDNMPVNMPTHAHGQGYSDLNFLIPELVSDLHFKKGNLTDVKWDDIEYYYVSRLQNEASPSPDFVVHPGVPRTLRVHFQYFL